MDITSNPWSLTPADVGSTVWATKAKLSRIVWSDQATVGDQLILQDTNGKEVVNTKASSVNFVQEMAFNGWVNGLVLTTMTSGKVKVFIH